MKKCSLLTGAHKSSFRPNAMTEDTKQLRTIERKARWWLLSCAPPQSFLFLQLELNITQHDSTRVSGHGEPLVALGIHGCLFQTLKWQGLPQRPSWNGCQKPHLFAKKLPKLQVLPTPPSKSATQFLSQSRQRSVAFLNYESYKNKAKRKPQT